MGKKRRGFTLVEVLIDAVVITVVFGALVGSFLLVLKTVNYGKVRTAATALANEKIELLRNMPYDDLATESGTIFPQGTIKDEETLSKSGTSYGVQTTIIFVDDPFDGCAIPSGSSFVCTDGAISSTQDTVPVDYKRVSLNVVETKNPGLTLASLSTNISGKAAETSSNTGMLLIQINDAAGLSIGGATVTVTNVSQGVTVIAQSNNQGNVFIANIPPDTQHGYHIVVEKNGYSSDYTTPRTPQNPNQYQPDVSVYPQQITTQTLAIDLLSTLQVLVKNESGTVLPGVEVTATGEKITQINPEIPKNSFVQTSDELGMVRFENIEWDSYTLAVPSSYYVVSTSPYQPVSLNPGTTLESALVITTDSSWPRIELVSPASGVSGVPLEITVEGDNLVRDDTAVVLRRAGQPDIPTSSLDVKANGQSLTATFDLSGAATGEWDIVITSSGKQVIQSEGLIIS